MSLKVYEETRLGDSPPTGNLNLQSRWPIFIVGNYLGGILAFGAGIGHENNRFSHESYPKVTKWET